MKKKKQEDLKDLTSDKAAVLRRVLEGLGISVSQDQNSGSGPQVGRIPPPVEVVHGSPLVHEGGNQPETQETSQDGAGLSEEGEESSSGSHDQGVSQVQEEEEAVDQGVQEEEEPTVQVEELI